jgi:hypothetical protein
MAKESGFSMEQLIIQETKNSIIDYLERFPEAKDTPEGIALWWIHKNPEEVAEALRELINEDVICEINLGKKKVYGLLGER